MSEIYSILTFTLIANQDLLLLPSKFGYLGYTLSRGETRLHSLQLPRISDHNLQLSTRTGSDLHVIPRKKISRSLCRREAPLLDHFGLPRTFHDEFSNPTVVELRREEAKEGIRASDGFIPEGSPWRSMLPPDSESLPIR